MLTISQVRTLLPCGAVTISIVAAFLNVWIVWGTPIEECLHSAQEVIAFLQELGFHIYVKKSRMTPAPRFVWLGLAWDLEAHTLSLPSSEEKGPCSPSRD